MAANDEPRYPSDLSDAEWKWIEPHIPGPAKLGRPPRYAKRKIINAIFYLTRSGCGWRMMPKDLPPWRICYYYFARWQKDGVWALIHEALEKVYEVVPPTNMREFVKQHHLNLFERITAQRDQR